MSHIIVPILSKSERVWLANYIGYWRYHNGNFTKEEVDASETGIQNCWTVFKAGLLKKFEYRDDFKPLEMIEFYHNME